MATSCVRLHAAVATGSNRSFILFVFLTTTMSFVLTFFELQAYSGRTSVTRCRIFTSHTHSAHAPAEHLDIPLTGKLNPLSYTGYYPLSLRQFTLAALKSMTQQCDSNKSVTTVSLNNTKQR